MKSRRLVQIVTAWLGLLILVGPVQAGTRKNMIVATSYRWNSMDPSVAYTTEAEYLRNTYETLLRVSPPGSDMPYEYVLATGMNAEKDGLEYVLDLRKGVKFHDGTPFNAAAVKFSLERTKRINKGAAFIWSALSEVKIINDYQVRIILKSAVPFPMIASSVYASYMISPRVGDAGEEYFKEGQWDAGTGPYQLTNYKAGESWILSRYEDYWRGWSGPHLDKVLYKFVASPLTQYQMLKSGQADVVSVVPPESISAVEKDPNLKYMAIPSVYNYFMFFNTQRKPFDNPKVRQALCYAIPYDDIIKVGFAGKAVQSRSVIPAAQFGYSEKVRQYRYDLDMAKKLLAEAGYANGFKATITYAAENNAQSRYMILLKDSFKKIGVDVDLEALMFNAQWAKAKGPEAQRQDMFMTLWWPTFNDPFETLYTILHDEKGKPYWNLSYWYNQSFDDLIFEAYRTVGSDPAKGKMLYEKAQNMIVDNAVVAPIVDKLAEYFMRSSVKGYDKPFAFKMGELYNVYIEN